MKPFGFLICLLFLLGCKKAKISSCDAGLSLFSFSSYPIGTAINIDALLFDSTYQAVALKQFNSFTAENIFKAEYLHPEPFVYNWTLADTLAYFCKTNNKRLFGHTLIWHKQLPQWMIDYDGNAAEWEQLMKGHIQTIVTHFKNTVSAWDVVNEAFNEDGTLRNSIWLQHIGPKYIEKAFVFAHEADPNALLFYNDYNLESNPTKRKSVLSLLNNLKNRGIKVDGVGLQMHISTAYPEASQISDAFQEVVDSRFRIHVSEMDISVNPLSKNIVANESLLNEQAVLLSKVVLNYNQIPSLYRYGITFWGVSDRYSWIRNFYNRADYPLLFDDDFYPKPCYCQLVKTL
jgi:endo-1,4-beta-xylanase